MSDLLNHLCQLARLNLPDDEREEFARKFASLLSFIDRIKELPLLAGDTSLHVAREKMDARKDIQSGFSGISEIAGPYSAGYIAEMEAKEP